MTPRQRLQTVLAGKIPDCVPVAPDFSNMIPARRTGKPFWQIYLWNDPPQWEAYLDTAKFFNIDALPDGFFPLQFPEDVAAAGEPWEPFIVDRSPERLIVQWARGSASKREWSDYASVYYVADPPTARVPLEKLGLPPVPRRFAPVEGRREIDRSPAAFADYKRRLGDQGMVGAWCAFSVAFSNEEGVYRYYDHPELHEQWARERVEAAEQRFARLMSMPVKPDFLCVGGSGTLVCQTVEMFRKVAFPAVKRAIELATAAGLPTHIHSCGPEAALMKIMAEETGLTLIDPLEIPPMGDCDLADLKRKYGHKIVLKGNLHTTNVMLRGSVDEVIAASRKAIDDAAAGGRFILATGDQCGRDTPDENLRAMIETARTYGRY